MLKLAGVLQEHHVRSLEKILTIITCIEDGWYGDWDKAKRRILFERKEEVREELRDRMEAASAWDKLARALIRMQGRVDEES